MTHRFALFASLFVAGPLLAQSPGDLTLKARAILDKHCSECHAGKPTNPSTLQVRDHAQMVKTGGPATFITPGKPLASQALDLVETGAMPPGRHEKLSKQDVDVLRSWIEAGAGAYPAQYDDEYAHAMILKDVENGPGTEAWFPNTRYLSLHHLVEGRTPTKFIDARKEFLDEVKLLIKETARQPQPIDPSATIFRIDLQSSGWDAKPFKRLSLKDGKWVEDGRANANLFDVVLLEYPHIVIPDGSTTFDSLVTKFIARSKQVRPAAFVRGDWFVNTAGSFPLAKDLRTLYSILGNKLPPGLETPRDPRASAPAGPIADKSVRLPALDAWYTKDLENPNGGVEKLIVGTFDFKTKAVRTSFNPDDRFTVKYTADTAFYGQFIWIDSANSIGRIATSDFVGKDKAGGAEATAPDGLGETPGIEQIRVYASPQTFPVGEHWVASDAKPPIERMYHPFFVPEKARAGNGFVVPTDHARAIRKTVTIEIVAKKK